MLYYCSRMYSSECKVLRAEVEKQKYSTNKVDTVTMTDETNGELIFSTVHLVKRDTATMTDILSGDLKQSDAHQNNVNTATMTDIVGDDMKSASAYREKVDAVTMTDTVVELESHSYALPILKLDASVMTTAPSVKQFADIGCQICSDCADKEQQTSFISPFGRFSFNQMISARRSRSYSDSELLDEASSTSSTRSKIPLPIKANVSPAPLSREVLFCKGSGVARSKTRTLHVRLPTTPAGSVNKRTVETSPSSGEVLYIGSGVARSKTRTIHVHLQTTPGGSEKATSRASKCVYQLQVKTLQQRVRSIRKQV